MLKKSLSLVSSKYTLIALIYVAFYFLDAILLRNHLFLRRANLSSLSRFSRKQTAIPDILIRLQTPSIETTKSYE